MSQIKTFLHNQLIPNIKKIIPPLSPSFHKGQAGKIGIIGGSKEYTGAPYYASISSLKASATLLKCYSPELIVIPVLPDQENQVSEKEVLKYLRENDYFGRLHAFVIGPGLGRDELTFGCVKEIIKEIIQRKKPLVIDGDGLYFVSLYPEIISGYKNCILTPNPVEFSRILSAVLKDTNLTSTDPKEQLNLLCQKLGNVTIIRKGAEDLISNGNNIVLSCTETGSNRRCGGQGDVLAGVLGTFSWWAQWAKQKQVKVDVDEMLLACYAACMITRACNREAFAEKHRGMTTPDMITKIPEVFEKLFPWKEIQ